MGLTYNTFTTSLANMMAIPVTDTAYIAALPNIIDDAEQRIYRELDFLQTTTRDNSQALTVNNRNFALPTTSPNGIFVVTEQINIITPAGTTDPELGTRNSLLPTTRETLDALYPSVTGSGIPQFFAMITQTTLIVGPWPDASYQVEVVGTTRPLPLSETNTTTFLSQNLPDLFLAAAMVFACGYQKNFSSMGDQPQSSLSWESHYTALKSSAIIEEARKKFSAEGWSNKQPESISTPPRT